MEEILIAIVCFILGGAWMHWRLKPPEKPFIGGWSEPAQNWRQRVGLEPHPGEMLWGWPDGQLDEIDAELKKINDILSSVDDQGIAEQVKQAGENIHRLVEDIRRGNSGRSPLTELEIAANLAKVAEVDEYLSQQDKEQRKIVRACEAKNISTTFYYDWSKVAEIDQHVKQHNCDIETACKALGYDPQKHYYRFCKIRQPKQSGADLSEKSAE